MSYVGVDAGVHPRAREQEFCGKKTSTDCKIAYVHLDVNEIIDRSVSKKRKIKLFCSFKSYVFHFE